MAASDRRMLVWRRLGGRVWKFANEGWDQARL